MLTKEQIKNIKIDCEDNGLYFNSELAIQAIQAIDLAEENERLNQQLTSLTGAYDDAVETAKYHEAENERLKATMNERCERVLKLLRSLHWEEETQRDMANQIMAAWNGDADKDGDEE